MTRRSTIVALAFALLFAAAIHPAFAQDAGNGRKIVNKVTPAYPSIARDMRISGSVKVEAVVSPNGSVKTVDIKGGHPVLAQAAADAVAKWKWEPAKAESREPIELKFMPVQ
ncbi:MAG TPA: TonB family protein [Terriglobales bacterium]